MSKTPKARRVADDVARMLQAKRPLSYEAIAERVRAKHPEARTTARSVASVASGLRAAGVELPDRRLAAH